METAIILFILFTLIAVSAFYAVFLRPVLKDEQRHRRDVANLRPGDRVLTRAGFLATVRDIRVPEAEAGAAGPSEIVLDLGHGVEVTAVPGAISRRLGPAASDRALTTEEARTSAEGGPP